MQPLQHSTFQVHGKRRTHDYNASIRRIVSRKDQPDDLGPDSNNLSTPKMEGIEYRTPLWHQGTRREQICVLMKRTPRVDEGGRDGKDEYVENEGHDRQNEHKGLENRRRLVKLGI